MEPLPRIRDHLPESHGPEPWIFIKPSVGKELTVLHEADDQFSLKPVKMAFRRMTLSPGQVVPFHEHEEKEKTYIALGDTGFMQVLILTSSGMQRFALTADRQHLIIPAGCPHAIIYSGVQPCSYLVITSTNDPADIRWEDAAEELILNQQS